MTTIDIRCPNCNRLLYKVDGLATIQIKCPKCNTISQYPIQRSEVIHIQIKPSAPKVGPTENKEKPS